MFKSAYCIIFDMLFYIEKKSTVSTIIYKIKVEK